MRFTNSAAGPQLSSFDPELRVVRYIGTRRDDTDRGPRIWLNPVDATRRLLAEDELAWIHGPRGQQVAHVVVDADVAEHTCVLRDVQGVDLADAIRVSKPDLDSPSPRRTFA